MQNKKRWKTSHFHRSQHINNQILRRPPSVDEASSVCICIQYDPCWLGVGSYKTHYC